MVACGTDRAPCQQFVVRPFRYCGLTAARMLGRFRLAKPGAKRGRLMTADDREPIDLVDSLTAGRISRRDFVRRGLLLGISVPTITALLASCGGDDDDDDAEGTAEGTGTAEATGGETTGTTAAPSGTTGAPAAGGTVRIAQQKPAATLDPIAMQDLGAYGLIAQSFEFLATLGENGAIAPGLATEWSSNEDGTVWTFNLQPGVKWHDGTDFTSADVAATLDRLA